MLEVNKGTSSHINNFIKDQKGIYFESDAALLFVGAVSDNIVHIRYSTDGIRQRQGYSYVTAEESDPETRME